MAFKHGDHKHDTVEQARVCASGGTPAPSLPASVQALIDWDKRRPHGGCVRTEDDSADFEAIAEARAEARGNEDAWDRYHERQAWGE